MTDAPFRTFRAPLGAPDARFDPPLASVRRQGTVCGVRISTWNVNSVRARSHRVAAYLDAADPDVVLLQETKCLDATFPLELFASRGYEVAHHGGGAYNGVAIASRVGLDDVVVGLGAHDTTLSEAASRSGWPEKWLGEARVISATTAGVRVVSVYVPNGRELLDPHYAYKLAWLDALRAFLEPLPHAVPALVGGDFNVAPADVDVWSPKTWVGRTHVSVPERDRIAALRDAGWVDLWRDRHGMDATGFTWWNYRSGGFAKNQGLRIDLLLANAAAAGLVTDVAVDLVERAAERPSDHAPLTCDLDLDVPRSQRSIASSSATLTMEVAQEELWDSV